MHGNQHYLHYLVPYHHFTPCCSQWTSYMIRYPSINIVGIFEILCCIYVCLVTCPIFAFIWIWAAESLCTRKLKEYSIIQVQLCYHSVWYLYFLSYLCQKIDSQPVKVHTIPTPIYGISCISWNLHLNS